MPYEVTKIDLFEITGDDAPGKLGKVLTPLAEAGVSLDFVLAYSMEGKAYVDVGVLTLSAATKKTLAAAGFTARSGATLFVTCPNKAGGGAQMGSALGCAGISMTAMSATALGSKAGVVAYFSDAQTAAKAATVIKKLGAPAAKKAAPKKAAGKKAAK
jgi:hypothetical protein